MHTTRFRRSMALPAAAVAAASALLLAACADRPCGHDHRRGGVQSPQCRLDGYSGSAEANSQGGRAIESAAQQVAAACKPVLGKQGYQAMIPGQPGAANARKAFGACEKIPKGQLPLLAFCAAGAWHAAPPTGAVGTPAENSRQEFLAEAVGRCVQNARKGAAQ